jgi:hypothetical protein
VSERERERNETKCKNKQEANIAKRLVWLAGERGEGEREITM